MQDKKNTLSAKSVGTDSHSTHRKRPTLSQQVNEQSELIEKLTARLQQKEQELTAYNGHTQLIDELAQKLQETEQAMEVTSGQVQSKAHSIDELTIRIQQQEQQIINNAEQTVLINELTGKLQEVEIKLASAAIHSRHLMAENITKTHMMAGMSLGLLPAPLIDIAALFGTQLNLLRSLSKHYGIDFDDQTGKAMLTSLISGALPVLTVVGLSSFAKLIPGIGTVGGGISITVLSSSIIYATGQVFIHHFEAGGTFQNFNSKHWQAFFKEQFESCRVSVRRKLEKPKTATNGTDTKS